MIKLTKKEKLIKELLMEKESMKSQLAAERQRKRVREANSSKKR